MPLRRAEIDTSMINPELGEAFDVPVLYTDELIETSLFDFAYSSAIGGFLPYLFVGFFTDGDRFNQWFFSNARRHEEMRQAIEQDLGKSYKYTYGQIWFNDRDLRDGELRFDKLILHSEPPNKKQAEDLLKKSIRPDRIHKDFRISLARY